MNIILYEIETAKGKVVCYEQNGIYYPAYDSDEWAMFEPILSIERINNDCDND